MRDVCGGRFKGFSYKKEVKTCSLFVWHGVWLGAGPWQYVAGHFSSPVFTASRRFFCYPFLGDGYPHVL